MKDDVKSFWCYVRSKTQTKSSIGDIGDNDGILNSDCLNKAEILNSFFSNVFVTEKQLIYQIYQIGILTTSLVPRRLNRRLVQTSLVYLL